jgi:oligopeptide/dipeptide ABC transporter ATP-binding protein
MDREPLRRLLGNEIAMVYEDPGKRLDPMMRVGVQVEEVMVAHRELSSAEMRERVIAELALMKLPEPEDLFDAYPHELADGMVHRVMLAMATILRPAILIADEPTSRFDAILKAQILDVLLRMKQESNLSMLLITHDMGAVVQLADQVAVMYAGRIAEVGSVQQIFRAPQHPYTAALIAALDPFARVQEPRLPQISGEPADLSAEAGHCPFLARCAYASETCVREPEPGLSPPDAANPAHQSACYHPIPPKA